MIISAGETSTAMIRKNKSIANNHLINQGKY